MRLSLDFSSHWVKSIIPSLLAAFLLTACFFDDDDDDNDDHQSGMSQLELGKDTFSYETFGNEGFWTDAMQLPQGLAAAGVTPLDALSLGLNVNVDALSPGTVEALQGALARINNGVSPSDTILGNPAVTLALINEGGVIGVVPFDQNGQRKPLGSSSDFKADDMFDPSRGDQVGVSCALCHAVTDNSVVPAGFAGPGSVGKQVDGRIAENLDVGSIFAASANPLAYLPFLQMSYTALDGASLGRGDFAGINEFDSIEAQTAAARRYLTGTDATGMRHYPLSSFDATPDGIGNATYIPPFFRTDLAAPWGSSGSFEHLDDFNNLVYTVALDPTSLLTEEGKGFLNFLAGPVGDEITRRYEDVLRRTAVLPEGTDADGFFPYVEPSMSDLTVGSPDGPVGIRVDTNKLMALNAYTTQLPAPDAPNDLDQTLADMGERIFMRSRAEGGANCIACHSQPDAAVEKQVRPMTQMYPRYADSLLVLLDRSDKGITPIQTTLAGSAPDYDLAVVVLDASIRGEPQASPGAKPGIAKPLLLGLNDKDEMLHNGSVGGADAKDALERLLNPERGADAPHPFYFPASNQENVLGGGDGSTGRSALVEYLRGRTTD